MYNKEIRIGVGLNNGYLYFIDIDHPLAYKPSGVVLLHRHIVSLSINRWLSGVEHVHHIDGNKHNNSINNLQILTASAHAKLHAKKSERIELFCAHCNTIFEVIPSNIDQAYCSDKCRSLSQIRNKSITKEILDELIPITSWTSLGAMFGYTDNGIRKRAIALGCDISKAKYKNKRHTGK